MPEQAEVVITRKMLKQQLSKMPKWKSSGSDGVHGHWLKSFTTIHDTIVLQLGEILTSGEVPSWMVTPPSNDPAERYKYSGQITKTYIFSGD